MILRRIILKRVKGNSLENILIAVAIIGIVVGSAMIYATPQTTKAKALDAKMQLKFIATLQELHYYQYSRYADNFEDIDFVPPKTTQEGGPSNYEYEIVKVTPISYQAQARAISDFDRDGVFNLWTIDESNMLKQAVKD